MLTRQEELWASEARKGTIVHAKRFLLSALILVSTLLAAPGAYAVVINASDYAVGTNLENAFPGVTLLRAGSPLNGGIETGPLAVGSITAFGYDDKQLSFNVLAATANNGINPLQGTNWAAAEALFSHPVTTVSVGGFDDSGDPIAIYAYVAESNNALIYGIEHFKETCVLPVPDGSCDGFSQTTTITFPTPIGFIFVGSDSAEGYVTKIDIPGIVPEPSSLALFGCGLLGLGVAILRRWRHARNSIAV